MLNCLKIDKGYIHILNHILDLASPSRWNSGTLEQQDMLSDLYNQYHGYWCSGDFRSQSINRHDIDPHSLNILSAASEELTPLLTHWEIWIQSEKGNLQFRFTIDW